ncbi:hypothetical protein IRY61_03730 [Candidatus Saccharibacteria bacterium]|nr:hypothetical protein [Candidatus Saccharibacteria bacterium]
MTTEIELLPMPDGEAFGVIQAWSRNQMRDYARANIAHATTTLQAEVERVTCELMDATTRADKLAEAVRGWWEEHRPVGWTEDQHRSCPHVNLATDAEKALATALLRYQEVGDEQ